MHTRHMFFCTIIVVLLVSACAGKPLTPNAQTDISTPTRTTSTTQSTEEVFVPPKILAASLERLPLQIDESVDISPLVIGNNKFALDLYQRLRLENSQKNLVFSPYSIAMALAMTYGGARNETAAEMRSVLHIQQPDEAFHQSWNALDQLMLLRAEAPNEYEQGVRLRVTNAVWAQQDYLFLDEYLRLLALNYGAGLQITDFLNFPEESRQAINQWTYAETEEKIKDLIPQGAIHQLTRMVLVNAIFLNAAWRQPFTEEHTQPGAFTLEDGSQIHVPLMWQIQNIPHSVNENYSLVELPYSTGKLGMLLIMPAEGQMEAFSQALDANRLEKIMTDITWGDVDLALPRFQFRTGANLNDHLSQLGMKQAFIPTQADFSGMEPGKELYIDQVIHQAFINVNENGTEAAAATVVMMAGKGFNPAEPAEIHFNRPFLFIIRDIETGAILFIGQVLNPAEQ